jgi:outer membrane protein assembly factor BamB
MTPTTRDVLIRAALTPTDDVRVPPTLMDAIHQAVLATPQRGGITVRTPLRWLPGGALAWALLLLGAVLTVALAALWLRGLSIDRMSVSTYHGDNARTGVLRGPGPRGEIRSTGIASLNGPIGGLNQPLIHDGTLYVADGRGGISTFALGTWEPGWTTNIGSFIGGTGVIAGGQLVVPADDGIVRSFRLSDGEPRWEQHIGAPVKSSLAVVDDLVLAGSDDGFVHALELATGSERWRVEVGGPLQRPPAIADRVGYVGSTDGRLLAFDAVTGTRFWTRDLGEGVIGTPAIREGVLYLVHATVSSTVLQRLLALDPATGDELWAWPAPTSAGMVPLAVTGATLYMGSSGDSTVYALDSSAVEATPLFTVQGQLLTLGALVEDVLYVPTTDRNLHAVETTTGGALWTVPVNGEPGVPVVSDGRVIVGTNLGKLIVIEGSE